MKKQRGFTIVELLIVIVVIGILAMITVVMYNSIQTRANNSATLSIASNFYKLVKLYVDGEGRSPSISSFCPGDNPDTNGDGIGDCSGTGNINQSDTANAELRKYGEPPSQRHLKGFTANGGNNYRGVAYYSNPGSRPIDGVAIQNVIVYYLQGDNIDCQNTNVLRDNGGTSWSTNTGQLSTYTGGGRTSCYVVVR